MKEENMTF